MRTLVGRMLLIGLMPLVVALPCRAQKNLEGDGFWEFIHKLSGPKLDGPGFSLQKRLISVNRCDPVCNFSPALRVSYAVLDVDEGDRNVADSVGLHVLNYQLAAEFPILGRPLSGSQTLLELGAGATVHRFRGHAVDNFNQMSFPFYAQIHAARRVRGALWIGARVGGGTRLFPDLNEDEFLPARVTLNGGGGTEFSGFYFFAAELRYTH